MTVHQDYLVHRLKELSAGGAISAFRWNGGSATFNSKPWKDEYPTDTVVIGLCIQNVIFYFFSKCSIQSLSQMFLSHTIYVDDSR